jgi:putative FmdB family regulatory protein
MPTYEYVCEACGHEFELFQSFSDSAISECPECKGSVRKVFSNVGVVFKGSGFYKNDSRATPAAPSAPAPAAKPATPSTD